MIMHGSLSRRPAPLAACGSWSWATLSADECRWLDASYGHR